MRRWTAIPVFVTCLAGSLVAASHASSGEAQAPSARAEVLVLGVYHMANPGRDVFNTQADDVLAPRRQAELAQLIAVLKKFQPTKIAVERTFSDRRIAREYADYVAGTRELTRNEVEQIGFRLARELGHAAVYPVDVDGEFPLKTLVNYVKANGRSEEFDAHMNEIGASVKSFEVYLASHSVLEALLHMNADERVAEDVGSYYRWAQFGEPWDWAGADLVAAWVKRNLRIFGNIAQLVDSPSERVLVVYGAGHLGWLQQAVAGSPNLRLRKLAEFVR